ncbi:MAG: amidohydrolase family protein [Bacteroidia bacterium]|nr:amidohydrolase family protein [Bacteroidia bacterium]MDW8133497.1 amidohydrolase family protein [Bacteroidia bacterium]
MNWIIREARILTPEGEIEGDAWIKEGRWTSIGRVPSRAKGFTYLARGAYLLPGLIDTHVHFREPGLTAKGNFYTESRAAIAGGVTTVFDMPNTFPPTTTIARWQAKFSAVQNRSWTNFSLYFGATAENLSEIYQLDPRWVPGVKIFLASSTGELLLTDERIVKKLLQESPVRLIFHSEKESVIQSSFALWGGYDWKEVPDLHTKVRPIQACVESTGWLLEEARKGSVPFHILHISTEMEVEMLRARPPWVSAETCPSYLQWNANDFSRYRNYLKCNPSLKYASDQEALWNGLVEGILEVVGTDHAPHLLSEKLLPYSQAPSGIPSQGYLLPWLWTLGEQRGLPVSFWIEKMVYAPARLWRLRDRGPIREGYWADAVVFRPESETYIPSNGSPLHYSKCQWSPLEGESLRGQVVSVWVNGELCFCDGQFLGSPNGMAVELE